MNITLLIVVALTVLWWARCDGAASMQTKTARDIITGRWVAPADFCLKAHLSSMELLLSAPRKDGSRLAHLKAVKDDGTAIADDYAVLRVTAESSWRRWLPTTWSTKNEGAWTRFATEYKSENAQSLFPKQLDLLANPSAGQLRFHGKKKILAVFDRDTAASQLLTEPA
jgi:hypothetical protein